MVSSDGGEARTNTGLWWRSYVQAGPVAVVKPAHERPVRSPSRRLSLAFYVRGHDRVDARPGFSAEVAGDGGIRDGAVGGPGQRWQGLLVARGLGLP